MTFSARVLLDSISPAGARIITMEWRYPRFIHSEVMTYRMFSRNTSSSRAIPVRVMIRNVLKNPAGPVAWGRNQRGMQARSELHGWRRWLARQLWYKARYAAVLAALLMVWLGLHKQIANRLLEPWMWITAIITGNPAAFAHCFRQRCHPDAQPEFQHLATLARFAYEASQPVERTVHTPLIDDTDVDAFEARCSGNLECHRLRLQVSTARCARVSYLTHDGRRSIEDDIRLHDQLLNADPPHASPFEHVLMASDDPQSRSGNAVGWTQYRERIDRAR